MTRAKILIGLTVLVGMLLTSAAPAFAEFESKNGSSNQGKGEVYAAAFEGGGARITCEAPEEEEEVSRAAWAVAGKEGKSQKKGPNLQVKIETWGECQTKASGLKEAETKLSACEMELKQTEEQTKAPVKIVNTCTIKVGVCEIKINSQEPKALELSSGGGNAENTQLIPAVSGMVWEVNSGCASLGIEASKAVAFAGAAELDLVEENPLAYQSKGGKFTDHQTKLTLLGEKETETAGTIACEESTYAPGSKGKSTTLLVTPELLKCKATLGKEAPKAVKSTNECKEGLKLSQPERFEGEEGPGLFRSKTLLLKGCKIALEAGSCTIKITGEGEELQWAYYYSLEELTLEEPETIFEVEGIKYATSEGCKGSGIPPDARAMLLAGAPRRFASNNGFGFEPKVKNVEPGGGAHVQEFKLEPRIDSAITCAGAEYNAGSNITAADDRLRLVPTFTTCELNVGGSMEAVTAIANEPANGCVLVLAALLGSAPGHKGDLSIAPALDHTCRWIKFTTAHCQVWLRAMSARKTVTYVTRLGNMESEVNFAVANLPWRQEPLPRDNMCIISGGVATLPRAGTGEYVGKTFLERLIVTP